MQPILEVKHLFISAASKEIIHGVSFNLYPGERLSIIGESGSGKTTLAHAILKLHRHQTQGEILFEGKNLLAFTEKEMQKVRACQIGMIFQDPATSLNPTMKIGKQLTEALLWHELIPKREANEKALELLNMVGIDNPALRASHYPFQLSGGMQQRVMIAQALSCNPKILIADEPTSALDTTTQFQILKLLDDLQEKKQLAILLITHDLNIVAQFCNRALIMKSGELIEDTSVQQLFVSPKHSYTRELVEASYA